MGESRPSILIVDDEPAQRRFLSAALSAHCQITAAANGGEAVELLRNRSFDLVLTDQRMPEMSGLELIEWMRAHAPEIPVVVLTAFGTIETAVDAMKTGAADYLTKPLQSPDELRLVVDRALKNRVLEQKELVRAAESEAEFPKDVIAESQSMRSVLLLARQVAPQPTTVLLTGESGTGKEIVSRFIHRQSGRANLPFVAVNCAALAENLLDSELFGHEKGAFTGAIRAKQGRFELAHGGTLFLDEIGATGMELQSKLLRALQESQFERVGGVRTLTVDVRVIAATNQDLAAAIQAGTFREDLFYRLNVFPIRIPPLRERRTDILPLAEHFIRKISARMGVAPKPLDAEAASALRSFDWPGNVRELQNAIERALIVSSTPELAAGDFPFVSPVGAAPAVDGSLAALEKEAILDALRRVSGDRKAAARRLGISLRKLQYRIKEYAKGRGGGSKSAVDCKKRDSK